MILTRETDPDGAKTFRTRLVARRNQIAFTLKQTKNGTLVAELCRNTGSVESSLYRLKKLYAE